jgi:hypothetical protein
MEKLMTLEEYLAEQKKFLSRFELLSLKRQNNADLAFLMLPRQWDEELGNFMVDDIIDEVNNGRS